MEIPGTDMDYVIRTLADLAKWGKKFFAVTSMNDHKSYGSSGNMFVAWNEEVDITDVAANLGEPHILLTRVYDDKNKPSDSYVIEFDIKKIDPEILENLPSEINKADKKI
jgi:hypothetical protein